MRDVVTMDVCFSRLAARGFVMRATLIRTTSTNAREFCELVFGIRGRAQGAGIPCVISTTSVIRRKLAAINPNIRPA